jgi:hypothetical protein
MGNGDGEVLPSQSDHPSPGGLPSDMSTTCPRVYIHTRSKRIDLMFIFPQ